MDARPVYIQGRGRGAGRGRGSPRAPPVGHSKTPRSPTSSGPQANCHNSSATSSPRSSSAGDSGSDLDGGTSRQLSAESRFQDAADQHQEAAKLHLGNAGDNEYESSEDEDELNDENILDSMLKSFRGTMGGNHDKRDLGRTQEYLMNSVKAKANVCLICIETIRRNDPIWSCEGCYNMFHISCIQKWVKDGVYQQTAFSDDTVSKKDIPWNCPKCRHEYHQHQCPTRYFCFCGQEEDPTFDPWLVPHSCGQVCGKNLKPECGHKCLLLCHPGPCPPCPQTVRVTCHCQQQPPQVRRCGASEWSCGKPCSRRLGCEQHSCREPCHPGECPTCPETSEQKCHCGGQSAVRPCASPEWQCEKVCGKALDCGHHTCERVCHFEDCGTCPRSGSRTCPCGKSSFELPCTEDVPTCVDTCGKQLACGEHECTQRCHTGPCGMCREMVEKLCRCGKKTREVQCFKEYLCETRCTKMRDCRKHPCRRKCCDGNCPTCEQRCGKNLGCRNHKCSSMCHRGPCYPCPLTVSISCRCAATTITVPCGRERVTRPPRCNERCKIPPDCHHKERAPHRCHFGPCPSCRFTCQKTLPNCEHICPVTCHSAVKTRIQEKVERAGPWEAPPQVREEIQDRPCPPCMVPVPVTCLGRHETTDMPCSMVRDVCCGRPCGRLLACTNHSCQLPCHRVQGAKDANTAGLNCHKCEEPCSKPRPEGCSHICLQPCHQGECEPCRQMIRMRCHCQLVVRHVECDAWTHADDRERNRLKSCQGICPKTLTCGHQCKSICHAGGCLTPDRCVEKVKVRCPCRRKKQDYLCNEVLAGYGKVECDELCETQKEKQKKQKDAVEMARKEEDVKRQKEEREEYARKLQGRRKRKPRKQRTEEETQTFLQRYGKFIIAPLLVVLLALFLYYIINK